MVGETDSHRFPSSVASFGIRSPVKFGILAEGGSYPAARRSGYYRQAVAPLRTADAVAGCTSARGGLVLRAGGPDGATDF